MIWFVYGDFRCVNMVFGGDPRDLYLIICLEGWERGIWPVHKLFQRRLFRVHKWESWNLARSVILCRMDGKFTHRPQLSKRVNSKEHQPRRSKWIQNGILVGLNDCPILMTVTTQLVTITYNYCTLAGELILYIYSLYTWITNLDRFAGLYMFAGLQPPWKGWSWHTSRHQSSKAPSSQLPSTFNRNFSWILSFSLEKLCLYSLFDLFGRHFRISTATKFGHRTLFLQGTVPGQRLVELGGTRRLTWLIRLSYHLYEKTKWVWCSSVAHDLV